MPVPSSQRKLHSLETCLLKIIPENCPVRNPAGINSPVGNPPVGKSPVGNPPVGNPPSGNWPVGTPSVERTPRLCFQVCQPPLVKTRRCIQTLVLPRNHLNDQLQLSSQGMNRYHINVIPMQRWPVAKKAWAGTPRRLRGTTPAGVPSGLPAACRLCFEEDSLFAPLVDCSNGDC